MTEDIETGNKLKTAMQELKYKLQIEVDRLHDVKHGTDQYGYRVQWKM